MLSEVLTLMSDNNLSAVPVVDSEDRVTNVYSRSDITFLATATDADSAVSNLRKTLGEILQLQHADVTTADRLTKGAAHQTLQHAFEVFSLTKFNRMICVDEDEKIVGVVSARDLVKYFINRGRVGAGAGNATVGQVRGALESNP